VVEADHVYANKSQRFGSHGGIPWFQPTYPNRFVDIILLVYWKRTTLLLSSGCLNRKKSKTDWGSTPALSSSWFWAGNFFQYHLPAATTRTAKVVEHQPDLILFIPCFYLPMNWVNPFPSLDSIATRLTCNNHTEQRFTMCNTTWEFRCWLLSFVIITFSPCFFIYSFLHNRNRSLVCWRGTTVFFFYQCCVVWIFLLVPLW
jgi:hypothetical protein